MEYRDYIIAFDENGQPYIEHGVFDRIKNSKYYQKIKTGYGWRYFYDPAEWEAYVNGQGNAPKSLIGKAKDKLGFDEKARYEKATKEANNAGRTYKNGEAGYDQAWATGNYAFGMPGVSVTVSKTDEEKARDKAEAEKRREEYANTPLGRIKDKFERMKSDLQRDAKYAEYDSKDPDFADENYSEKNWVEDTDFYAFAKPDGHSVILEEDMKWVLPKGIDVSSPEFRKAMQGVSEMLEKEWSPEAREVKIKAGEDPATFTDRWREDATRLINEAVKATRSK